MDKPAAGSNLFKWVDNFTVEIAIFIITNVNFNNYFINFTNFTYFTNFTSFTYFTNFTYLCSLSIFNKPAAGSNLFIISQIRGDNILTIGIVSKIGNVGKVVIKINVIIILILAISPL